MQDIFAAAVQLQTARLRALNLLSISAPKLLSDLSAAVIASPLPALLSATCLLAAFGLTQPFTMQQHAPLCTQPGDVRCIGSWGGDEARPHALECGWHDRGRLDASGAKCASEPGPCDASGAWAAADGPLEVSDALVRVGITARRMHSTWLSLVISLAQQDSLASSVRVLDSCPHLSCLLSWPWPPDSCVRLSFHCDVEALPFATVRCAHHTRLVQVPNATTTAHRARVTAWHAHHAHAMPSAATPDLPLLMARNAPAFGALTKQLAEAAAGTGSQARGTHVGMGALLRAAALCAAMLAGFAEAAVFHQRAILPGARLC